MDIPDAGRGQIHFDPVAGPRENRREGREILSPDADGVLARLDGNPKTRQDRPAEQDVVQGGECQEALGFRCAGQPDDPASREPPSGDIRLELPDHVGDPRLSKDDLIARRELAGPNREGTATLEDVTDSGASPELDVEVRVHPGIFRQTREEALGKRAATLPLFARPASLGARLIAGPPRFAQKIGRSGAGLIVFSEDHGDQAIRRRGERPELLLLSGRRIDSQGHRKKEFRRQPPPDFLNQRAVGRGGLRGERQVQMDSLDGPETRPVPDHGSPRNGERVLERPADGRFVARERRLHIRPPLDDQRHGQSRDGPRRRLELHDEPTPIAAFDPLGGQEHPGKPSAGERRLGFALRLWPGKTVREPDAVAGRNTGARFRRRPAPEAARRGHGEKQDHREPVAFHTDAATGFSSGRSNRTRKPLFSRFSAVIDPPCSSTIFFAIASPNPVPPLFAEKYGSKRRVRFFASTPGPVSSTLTKARESCRRAVIRISPFAPASASTALTIRFEKTRARRRASACACNPGSMSTDQAIPRTPA